MRPRPCSPTGDFVTRLFPFVLLVAAVAPAAAPSARAAAPAGPRAVLSDTSRTGSAGARASGAPDDALADSARVDEVMAWLAQEAAARQRADAARQGTLTAQALRPQPLRPQPLTARGAPPREASPMRTRIAALRASLAVPAHLAVPAASEGLVERQTAVVAGGLASAAASRGYLFPMIERALASAGLPPELKYVALIESALDPSATSRVGAAGLWQFMPGTAADYGLDQWSVRDPYRSTDAAVRYLSDLGRAFDGDYQLALAAYNCGPGRVARLVAAHRRQTGETATYWDIRSDLPAETRDYVVRFIAAARLLDRPAGRDI